MYSENFHSEDDYNPPHRKKPNGMATASVIPGIVALSSVASRLSAVIFGALSILLRDVSPAQTGCPNEASQD